MTTPPSPSDRSSRSDSEVPGNEADPASTRVKGTILVVDDHVEMARLLADQLQDDGYVVEVAASGAGALQRLQRWVPDVVITDLRMEGVDGFDILRAARAADPPPPVLIMTAFGAVESAIEAIRAGAYHYLTKPFELREVLLYVERALEEHRMRAENRALLRFFREQSGAPALIGRSAPMRRLVDQIEGVARSGAPVLVRGESGVGKELVARSLHLTGPRRERAFVAVNCTALAESLLESELFGHVRGAFTGATSARRGLFVEADGGTLFLDEVGDMPVGLQARLLRVLEDGEVRAVGGDTVRRVDVRLVAATHRDLERLVEAGEFRADLFYRLNVVPLRVPSLRERREDIPLLVEHFVARARQASPGSVVRGLTSEAVASLARRDWPGNVRELANAATRLVVLGQRSLLDAADVDVVLGAVSADGFMLPRSPDELVSLREFEDAYVEHVVNVCAGNKTRAAEILGIDVSTIHRRAHRRG